MQNSVMTKNAVQNFGFENANEFCRYHASNFAKTQKDKPAFQLDWIKTPLGMMVAIADERHLYLLEFITRKSLNRQVTKLYKYHGRAIQLGRTQITDNIEAELGDYFNGRCQDFKTPIMFSGTAFQNATWQQLCQIPYAQTRSYAELAQMVGNKKAVRAVASANARNALAIIVPCHRVIASDGSLGGYADGLDTKSELLRIEGF